MSRVTHLGLPCGAGGLLTGSRPRARLTVDYAMQVHGPQAWSMVDHVHPFSLRSLVYGAPGAPIGGAQLSLSCSSPMPVASSPALMLWWPGEAARELYDIAESWGALHGTKGSGLGFQATGNGVVVAHGGTGPAAKTLGTSAMPRRGLFRFLVPQ